MTEQAPLQYSLEFQDWSLSLYEGMGTFGNAEALLDHLDEHRDSQPSYTELFVKYKDSGLFGLLFRQNPLDIIRILLSRGGRIVSSRGEELSHPFAPVVYSFTDLEGKELHKIGDYYYSKGSQDADDEFPIFSRYLSFDLHLTEDGLRNSYLEVLDTGSVQLSAITDHADFVLMRKEEGGQYFGHQSTLEWFGMNFTLQS